MPKQPEIPTAAAPELKSEYIPPASIIDFLYNLKDAGQRGFRLDKITALPSGEYATSKKKSGNLNLAGIVKYDGTQKYDYNFFFAEGEPNAAEKLNSLTQNGWYFREVISVYGAGKLNQDGVFANSAFDLPSFGNVYILERISSGKNSLTYQLLKAGIGTGRSPTPKMQGLLDEAVKKGFQPVASYQSFVIKSLFSVDAYCAVLMVKDETKSVSTTLIHPISVNSATSFNFTEHRATMISPPIYRFVRDNTHDGMHKDVEAAAKEGFRVFSINYNSAVLIRAANETAPVALQWVTTDQPDYTARLTAAANTQLTYCIGGINVADGTTNDFVKNVLIFEVKPNGATAPVNYQSFIISPLPPKKKKKQPAPPAPTENPVDVFKKMLSEILLPAIYIIPTSTV